MGTGTRLLGEWGQILIIAFKLDIMTMGMTDGDRYTIVVNSNEGVYLSEENWR